MLPGRRHTFSHFALDIRIAALWCPGAPAGVADDGRTQWVGRAVIRELGLPAPVRSIIAAATGNPEPSTQSAE
jgi:A/G-specific adenine glycosylase